MSMSSSWMLRSEDAERLRGTGLHEGTRCYDADALDSKRHPFRLPVQLKIYRQHPGGPF